jgi:hypothetical protein
MSQGSWWAWYACIAHCSLHNFYITWNGMRIYRQTMPISSQGWRWCGHVWDNPFAWWHSSMELLLEITNAMNNISLTIYCAHCHHMVVFARVAKKCEVKKQTMHSLLWKFTSTNTNCRITSPRCIILKACWKLKHILKQLIYPECGPLPTLLVILYFSMYIGNALLMPYAHRWIDMNSVIMDLVACMVWSM